MDTVLKFILIGFSLSLAQNSYARTEFPFCPSGGPPGWMNYFDYKRDKNIWRNYYHHPRYSQYYPAWPASQRRFHSSHEDGVANLPRLFNHRHVPDNHMPSRQPRRSKQQPARL